MFERAQQKRERGARTRVITREGRFTYCTSTCVRGGFDRRSMAILREICVCVCDNFERVCVCVSEKARRVCERV